MQSIEMEKANEGAEIVARMMAVEVPEIETEASGMEGMMMEVVAAGVAEVESEGAGAMAGRARGGVVGSIQAAASKWNEWARKRKFRSLGKGGVRRDLKGRGEWAEMQFMARATQHGLTVAKPWGDKARYDFLVEYRGKTKRVQVKSTACRVEARGPFTVGTSQMVGPTGRGRPKRYTKRDIDFFAFYLAPEDLWYLVPIEEHLKTGAFLDPWAPRNKYFKYLEAWGLLRK